MYEGSVMMERNTEEALEYPYIYETGTSKSLADRSDAPRESRLGEGFHVRWSPTRYLP